MTDYDPTGQPTILIARSRCVCKKCGYEQIENVYGPKCGIRVDDLQAIVESRFRDWTLDEDGDVCPECNVKDGADGHDGDEWDGLW